MHRTSLVALSIAALTVVRASGARAEDPAKPSPAPAAPSLPFDGSRAALVVPEDVWRETLAGLALPADGTLGFTAEQMANYGRDQRITRPIATSFRDVRAIPRMTGRLSDSLLEAAKDPSELVRIAFGLSDAVAGRMLERPKGAAWGVPWLPDGVAPQDAFPKVLERIATVYGGGGALSDEERRTWRALPEAVQRLVVRILVGCAEGASWLRAAFDTPFLLRATGGHSADHASMRALLTLAARPFTDVEDDATSPDRAATRASFEALDRVDRDSLAFGSVVTLLHLAVGLEEWRAARATTDLSKVWFERFEIPTALGRVRLLGVGADVETGPGSPALLELDLGGDDVRRGRHAVPASLAEPISLVVDLAGHDRYEAGDVDGTFGCGLFGLGAVIDLGGDDVYAARDSALGCAWYGAGLLLDEAGDDRYTVGTWGQGAAHVGAGVLCDLAGKDAYECAQQAQGLGATLGGGVLLDVAGDDTYVARDDGNREKIYLDQSVAMAQGCGYGRRADLGDGHSLAGGIGILVDGGGDDRYHAMVWSQGCAYWWAVGILEDRGGNDVYENGKYSSGAGAHFGVGVHVDLAGDDRYNAGVTTAVNQYQGHARDGSIGIFLDGDGRDTYRLRNHCAGAGDLGSIGFFWDRRGDDTYEVVWNELGPPNGWNETPPFGAATTIEPQRSFRDDLGTYGLFLDTGGRDTYRWDVKPTQDAKDGGRWTRRNGPRSFGFGLDADGVYGPPTPAPTPAPTMPK